MELKKKVILIIVIPLVLGVISGIIGNYFYDNVKNHSTDANSKSGYEFEFKLNVKFR